jgi:tetratricopeptide (TPR) repeat protein
MRLLVALCAAQITAYSADLDPSLLEEALLIADQLEDRSYQLRALWGLIHSELVARRPLKALMYARRFESLALTQPGQPEIQLSDHLLGWTNLATGDLITAKKYLEKFLKNYTSPSRRHTVQFGYAKRLTANTALAVVMWLQGLPEQALTLVEDSLAEAEKMQHGATTLYALGYGTCFIALFTRNLGAGRRHLSALDNAVHMFKRWEKLAVAYKGMVARQEGDLALALERFNAALSGNSAAKVGILYALLLLEQAELRCEAGDLDGSERAVELALECQCSAEDVVVVCETLRVTAQIVRARGGDGSAQRAETMLVESIRVARTQRALTLELASATSLARFWTLDGRRDEAKGLLRPIVDQFSEGFNLPPILQARALL